MQVQRKPVWVERGKTWETHSVPRLYLEDIEFIFRVMTDYAEHSPNVRRTKDLHEAILDRRRAIEVARSARGEESAIEPLPPVRALEPPVKMEVDDYLPSSIDELMSLNLKDAARFDMQVGSFNLRLGCSGYVIRLSTDQDDEPALSAFEEIRNRVQKRESAILNYALWPIGYLMLSVLIVVALLLALVTDSSAISLIPWVLIATSWSLLFWNIFFWSRRSVVMLDYRKNVGQPWYRCDAMKQGIVITTVTVILTLLLELLVQ
jgi:hypothetical protein